MCSRLTEVTSGPQDDDDGVLTLHGLLHVIFVQDVPHYNSGGLVVGRESGWVTHQHSNVVTFRGGNTRIAYLQSAVSIIIDIRIMHLNYFPF